MKITIANQKGGAGKTSFAVLVCLALAEQGKKVLAIDCDPQGGMSEFLSPHSGQADMSHMLMGAEGKCVSGSTYENINVITSSYELDKLYVTVDHLAFKRTLKHIENDYDYIVFDTPPTMQGITRAAIHYSDKILVPTEISQNAMGPTLYTLKCIEEMEKKGQVVFIENMSQNTTKYKKDLFDEYKSKLNGNFAGILKRNDTTKKIVSGKIKLTESKIDEFLTPVYDIVVGLRPYQRASLEKTKKMLKG